MADNSAYISELSARTGLATSVVAAWVSRENGADNNVLGVTGRNGVYGGAGLFSYPSQVAGADAAANLINTSPLYAGIRDAVKTGDPAAEALAIVKSPWRGSQPGGFDKYYYNGFAAAGILPAGMATPQSAQSQSGQSQSQSQPQSPNPFGDIHVSTPLGDVTIPNFSSPFLYVAIALVGMTFVVVGGFLATKSRIDYGAIAKSGASLAAAAA
jgi:hypothetical protein